MTKFSITLKLAAPIFILVGCLHLLLGLSADVMLGAQIPSTVLADPVLDSQNRFYGISFTLYGVLLWLCADNIKQYSSVLRCLFLVFFAAGMARLVSIALVGLPSALILGLLATELLLPPILLLWLRRLEQQA